MANNEVVGAYRLCNNPSYYEPQRSNNFKFVVTGIDNIIKAGVDVLDPDALSEFDIIANAQETLELSVSSAQVPTFTQGVLEVRRGNSVMKAAGTPTYQSGQIAVRDFIGRSGRSALQAWQNLSYNSKKQTVGHMADYKKDCYLIEYDLDFSKILTIYVLHGCWISNLQIPEFNNSQESNSERMITATIEYDWFEISGSDEE